MDDTRCKRDNYYFDECACLALARVSVVEPKSKYFTLIRNAIVSTASKLAY